MTEYLKYYNEEEKASLYLKTENEYVTDSARDKIYADRYGHSVTRLLIGMHIADVDEIMSHDENMSKIGSVDEKEWLSVKAQFLRIKNKENEIDENRVKKQDCREKIPEDLLEKKERRLNFKNIKRHSEEKEEEFQKRVADRRIKVAKQMMLEKMRNKLLNRKD